MFDLFVCEVTNDSNGKWRQIESGPKADMNELLKGLGSKYGTIKLYHGGNERRLPVNRVGYVPSADGTGYDEIMRSYDFMTACVVKR